MIGVPPPAQRRMSTAAQEACDGLFERKYATFKNGRLPGSDAEIKAMEAFFSIKFVHISARLLKWRKLKQVSLPALNLCSHERGEVQADIENRIDGADLVSEVLEPHSLQKQSTLGLWQRYREDAPRMTRRTFCATLSRLGFE